MIEKDNHRRKEKEERIIHQNALGNRSVVQSWGLSDSKKTLMFQIGKNGLGKKIYLEAKNEKSSMSSSFLSVAMHP